MVGDKYDIYAGTASAALIPVGSLLASARETRWGGTVGAGLEVGFAPNWSVGVEYDHIFLGSRTVNSIAVPGGFLWQSDRIRQDVDIGLVRLNYRWAAR